MPANKRKNLTFRGNRNGPTYKEGHASDPPFLSLQKSHWAISGGGAPRGWRLGKNLGGTRMPPRWPCWAWAWARARAWARRDIFSDYKSSSMPTRVTPTARVTGHIPEAYANLRRRAHGLPRAGLGLYMGLENPGSALCHLHTWKTGAKRHLQLSMQPFLP